MLRIWTVLTVAAVAAQAAIVNKRNEEAKPLKELKGLFPSSRLTYKEDVVVNTGRMGGGRFAAVLQLLAESNATWIADNLLPKAFAPSDKIPVSTYTNVTGHLQVAEFTCNVQDTHAWYSQDFYWPDVILSGYENVPNIVELSRKGPVSVKDWLKEITTCDPWAGTFNATNPGSKPKEDEVWRFFKKIENSRLSIIQTRDDATKLEPFTAYLVVGAHRGADKDNLAQTHIELYNSTIHLLPKDKPFNPATIEIIQDTEVLVQLADLPDLAKIAHVRDVAP